MEFLRTMRTKHAATYLGLAEKTLHNWRTLQRGPKYRKLGRAVVYLKSDLDVFLDEALQNSSSASFK
jgi:predicted DNA-binding transcriptional regulator AlpA